MSQTAEEIPPSSQIPPSYQQQQSATENKPVQEGSILVVGTDTSADAQKKTVTPAPNQPNKSDTPHPADTTGALLAGIEPTQDVLARNRPTQASQKDGRAPTSLHRVLLGASVMKAGQTGVDQDKVARIIEEASRGSKFFQHQQEQDENRKRNVAVLKRKKRELDGNEFLLRRETKKADAILEELESKRRLDQYIVQVDCDAFYASVEELDHPEYKNIPVGVGGSVITTGNYMARKWGVRSGMAGHIAKKLCPELLLVPPNFKRYMEKAHEIRYVLSGYDDQLHASSIDEAYLNITDYCEVTGKSPDEVVSEMRAKVHEFAKVTVSAGIAPNDLIAKIASNKNKPNGQYRVANTREACMEFMRDLPCRKVTGIGAATEHQLEELGIKTCGQIYEKRGYLLPCFGEKVTRFLLEVYLGVGETEVRPSEEEERKTVGTERTISEISGRTALRHQMKATALQLQTDMENANAVGRTLVLRLKKTNFESHTHQRRLDRAIYKAEDIYEMALPLLRRFEDEWGTDFSIRLLGLRLADLSPLNRPKVRFEDLGKKVDTVKRGNLQLGQVPKIPESEFPDHPGRQKSLRPKRDEPVKVEKPMVTCEGCGQKVEADDVIFSDHLDWCLGRHLIKATMMETLQTTEREGRPPQKLVFAGLSGPGPVVGPSTGQGGSRSGAGRGKRKRPLNDSAAPERKLTAWLRPKQ